MPVWLRREPKALAPAPERSSSMSKTSSLSRFVALLTVEAFDEGVLRRLAVRDIVPPASDKRATIIAPAIANSTGFSQETDHSNPRASKMLKFYVDFNAREISHEGQQAIIVRLDLFNDHIPESDLQVGMVVTIYDEGTECQAVLRRSKFDEWLADIRPDTIRHVSSPSPSSSKPIVD